MTTTTTKLTRRTRSQIAAAREWLSDIVEEITPTTVTFRPAPATVAVAIDYALRDVTDRGVRNALHSLRRAAVKLAEDEPAAFDEALEAAAAKPEPRPLVCSVCGTSVAEAGVGRDGAYFCPPCDKATRSQVTTGRPHKDRAKRLAAAKREAAKLVRWKEQGYPGGRDARPATVNLDALEAESAKPHKPTGAKRKPRKATGKAKATAGRERKSGSSATEGPPPRCPGVGQTGVDGPGSTRCTVCSQDKANVKRDGTVGSHKLLKARPGAEAAWNAAVAS
jgi:hypothetical protein